MLRLQTVIHCCTLQAQISFWFNSAWVKFLPKHSCYPNYGETDEAGWIGMKRNSKVLSTHKLGF